MKQKQQTFNLNQTELNKITEITDTIYDLYSTKEITTAEYNNICSNLGFIISRYFTYFKNGINIKIKTLIEDFVRR